MKKTAAGIAAASALVLGGGVVTDNTVNPYTQNGTQLEIQHHSSLPEGGAVKMSADTEKPTISLSKWGGEVALGVTYTGIHAKGNRPLFSKNVEWKAAKQTMEAIPLDATTTMEDGGMEININLDSKPASNIFTFQLDNWQNLDFFYQPALTPEEVAEGGHQPDNVIGSYAVYYKNHANHIEGQTNYSTGKAYHIYRPLVTDANGMTTWADLGYTDGVLTVTVPQSFLDSAAYPVVVDPTFGYTTIGGTTFPLGNTDNDVASLVNNYAAITGDTVTQYSVYGNCVNGANGVLHMATYSIVTNTPVTRLDTAQTIAVPNTTPQWLNSSTISVSLTNGTTYNVARDMTVNCLGTSAFVNVYRDITTGKQNSQAASGALPATWTETVSSASQYSMYATYTAAAAATPTTRKPPTINNGSIKVNNGHIIIKY